jgi:Lon protease-like protein
MRLAQGCLEKRQSKDACHGRAGIVILNLNAEVRARIAFTADFKKRAKQLRIARQRPVDEGGDAPLNQLDRAIQPDADAVVGYEIEIPVAQERASPERNHAGMSGLHLEHAAVERLRLDAAEFGFAVMIEDGGDAQAMFPLDLLIEIHEIPSQFVGQGASYGGLAAAHKADQINAGSSLEFENHGAAGPLPLVRSRESDNSSMQEGLLPLFPLQVVLFPGAELPLHIFEDRYKEMIGEAVRDHFEFGVVLANEKGMVNTGCTATVERVLKQYPDGRMDILTRGRRRFEILLLNSERAFLRGSVDFFDDEPSDPATPEIQKKALDGYNEMQVLFSYQQNSAQGSAEVSSPEGSLDPRLSFRLAQPIPDLGLRQLLLAMRSEAERLRHLAEFFPDYLVRQKRVQHVKNIAPRNGHGRAANDDTVAE